MNDANLASADHTPPLKNAIPLGLQHVLAMFAGNITVPIIIAGVVGATPEEKVFLIQVALFIAGVATLIQTIGVGPLGARLPVMQGTSFGFLPVIIPLAKTFGIKAVLGGAAIVMFGVMAAAGLKLIARAELNRRSMLIIGVCLSAGIALPLVPAFTAHMQADVAVLVSSGLVPAALLALLLNWILLERGA